MNVLNYISYELNGLQIKMGWNGAHNSFPHITLSSSFACPDSLAPQLMEAIIKVFKTSSDHLQWGQPICVVRGKIFGWLYPCASAGGLICRKAWMSTWYPICCKRQYMYVVKAQICRKKRFEIPITMSLEKILWILFRHVALPLRLTYHRQNKMIIRSLFDQV